MLILVTSCHSSGEFKTAVDTALVCATLEKPVGICFSNINESSVVNEQFLSALEQLKEFDINVSYKNNVCSQLFANYQTCLSF